MPPKTPTTLTVIAIAALSTACSVITPVPAEKHPIHSTVVLEAQSSKCLESDLTDVELHEQIQSDANVVRAGVNVSEKNYADRLQQVSRLTFVDSASCQLLAENAAGLKLASEYFASYPAGRGREVQLASYRGVTQTGPDLGASSNNFTSYSYQRSMGGSSW